MTDLEKLEKELEDLEQQKMKIGKRESEVKVSIVNITAEFQIGQLVECRDKKYKISSRSYGWRGYGREINYRGVRILKDGSEGQENKLWDTITAIEND